MDLNIYCSISHLAELSCKWSRANEVSGRWKYPSTSSPFEDLGEAQRSQALLNPGGE